MIETKGKDDIAICNNKIFHETNSLNVDTHS